MFRRAFKGRDWWLAQCRCGLRFTHPAPGLDDLLEFYSGSYHSELLDGGDRKFAAKFKTYISMIPPDARRGRSLDVGCTTGLFPAMLRDAGFDAEGLEVNPAIAAWGRAHYGLSITEGTFEEFVAPDGSFDLITMMDVLEHTIDPLAALKKVNQLLRPGGLAMFSFPDISAPKSRYYKMLARVTGREWLWITCAVPLHVWEFTRATALTAFGRAGFEPVRFARTGQPEERLIGKHGFLSLPALAFDLPAVGAVVGIGMIFLMRKARAAGQTSAD